MPPTRLLAATCTNIRRDPLQLGDAIGHPLVIIPVIGVFRMNKAIEAGHISNPKSGCLLKEFAPDQHAANFACSRADLVKLGVAQ
jgi:hypothetical protein